MKVIKIKESQKKRLFEAYREGFSFKTLSSLAHDSDAQYKYCTKWLGEPDGFGSSRCVFTLSDNMVLKLNNGEYNNAGASQNQQECGMFQMYNSPLLVKIYKADKNFTYIVCENVIPAKEEDFEKILGIPFWHNFYQNSEKMTDTFSKNKGDVEIGYNEYFDNIKKPSEKSDISLYDILSYIEANYVLDENYYDKNLEDVISKSKWLQDFAAFVNMSKITDFCDVENFGIVNRDGTPTLVIIDSGMNLELWEKHYG